MNTKPIFMAQSPEETESTFKIHNVRGLGRQDTQAVETINKVAACPRFLQLIQYKAIHRVNKYLIALSARAITFYRSVVESPTVTLFLLK